MIKTATETEGDNNLVQHFEISSTSDFYYMPLHPSKSFPKCRSSYRRRFLRNHCALNRLPNSRIMKNPCKTNKISLIIM